MTSKLVRPLLVLGSAVALTAATTSTANAFTGYTPPTEQDYYEQLGGKYGLDYETWSLFDSYINDEENGLSGNQLTALDSSALTWEAGVDGVDVFFINEGAKYRNEFGYSTDGGQTINPIWDDVASSSSIYPENGPLALGEGMQLGSFGSGTVLDFFLTVPDTEKTFGADASQNPDDKSHLTVYQSGEYLLIGFEDQTDAENSDWDYNDVVFAVKGLIDTEEDPGAVPEPATTAALLGLGMLGLVKTRRRQSV